MTYLLTTVRSMEVILLSLNADFAALLLSGTAGVQHISASLVTSDNATETMFLSTPRISFRNAKAKILVHSK